MSEVESAATQLTSQYAAQVAADLERNTKEQERIGAEVAALEEQLRGLRHDQTLLAELQRALGGADSAQAAPAAGEGTASGPSVPRQASATTARRKKAAVEPATAKTSTAKPATGSATAKAAATKSAAAKPAAGSAAAKAAAAKPTAKSAAKAGTSASAAPKSAARSAAAKPAAAAKSAPAQPTLVELIRDHLGRQSEPRSSAEVATALAEAHPDREIKPKVVRTTVEGLVAKAQVQRTKQGSSVFYTTSRSTAAPAASADTAGAGTEQAPESA